MSKCSNKAQKSAPTIYKIMQKCMDNCSNNVQKFVVTSNTSTFYNNPSTTSRSHYAIAARQGSRERRKPCPLSEPPSPSHQMERNLFQPSYTTTKGIKTCFSRPKNHTAARQEQKNILACAETLQRHKKDIQKCFNRHINLTGVRKAQKHLLADI